MRLFCISEAAKLNSIRFLVGVLDILDSAGFVISILVGQQHSGRVGGAEFRVATSTRALQG